MIDLLAQVVNIDIDDIGEGLKIIAPDRIDNLRAREHLARMAHQVLQEGKLFGRQLDDTTGATRLVSHQVERQVTGRELRDLVKPFAMEELLARINALLRRRDRRFDETLQLSVGDLTLDLVRHEARRAGRVIELTSKEFALLEYLMRHPGRVLTRTQIIDAVWRYDLEALSNVVDIYIHYLREKIDHGFSHSLIKTVRGVGYKIET